MDSARLELADVVEVNFCVLSPVLHIIYFALLKSFGRNLQSSELHITLQLPVVAPLIDSFFATSN